MLLFRRGRQRLPGSPVQRLCGLAFALLIMLQTPMLTVPMSRKGRVVDVPFSALEIAGLGVVRYQPEYADAVGLALLPGGWWKTVSKVLVKCMSRESMCDTGPMWDRQALWQACDYSNLVDPFFEVTGHASTMLTVSSGMLVACAVAMPVAPELWVAVVALGMFVLAVFQTPCLPLPTMLFMGLLCLLAVFGKERGAPPSARGRSVGAGRGLGGTASAGGKAAAGGENSAGVRPGTPSRTKKRR